MAKYKEFKNVDELITEYRLAVDSNPDCGHSRYNLAMGFLGKRLYDEAERELKEAVACSPSLAEAYVALGGIRLEKGDLEGCLEFNTLATKSRAGFAEGYANIGFCQAQMGKFDDAVRNLRKAINFNQNFIQAYTTLASVYFSQGLVEESIAACEKALELNPNFAVAHNNLALAYLELEQYDRAIEHCDKALELGFDVHPGLQEELKAHR